MSSTQADPLSQLAGWIAQARQLPAPAALPLTPGDPLNALRAQLLIARDEERWPAPLDALRELMRQPPLASAPPEYPVPAPGESPLALMRRAWTGATAPRAVAPDAAAPRPNLDAAAPRPSAASAPPGALGEEFLRALATQALPGPARAHVAAMLVDALQEPDPELLRRILALVITGA